MRSDSAGDNTKRPPELMQKSAVITLKSGASKRLLLCTDEPLNGHIKAEGNIPCTVLPNGISMGEQG